MPVSDRPSVVARDLLAGESAETLIVLIAAADASLAETLSDMLDQWGASALIAGSLEEANGMIENLGLFPDALLVDPGLAESGDADLLTAMAAETGNVTLLADRKAMESLPPPLHAMPSLAVPVQPHRLRALLFR